MQNRIPEILLVTRPLTPPWDEASKNLAYFLATQIKGLKFHILVGEYNAALPKNITQHLIYRGAEWNLSQRLRLIMSLKKILKENPAIDIAHLLFAPTPLNSLILKRILRKPHIKIIHNLACPPRKDGGKLLFGDKIIVYSKHTAGKIKQKNTSIIAPFIDNERFQPISQKSRRDLRKKFHLKHDDRALLYPGEYSRLEAMGLLWKTFIKLKQSEAQAKKKNPGLKTKCRLIVACRIKSKEDKIKEEKFKKLVSLSPYAEDVIFLGKIERPERMYQMADLTVFPVKKMDGKFDFPFVLLESLACGTPILTSNIGALPEIWSGNEKYLKQFVFDLKEEKAFSVKIKKILSNDVERKEMTDWIDKKFQKAITLEKYRKIYEKMTSIS